MTITDQPPRLLPTQSFDYAKVELAIPWSAYGGYPFKQTELLHEIALALGHEDGTPAEVIGVLVAWTTHLDELKRKDRVQTIEEWEAELNAVCDRSAADEEKARDEARFRETDGGVSRG